MTVPRPELTGDYDIDPEHSRLGFVARHAMITKVRGSFKKFEGWLHIDGTDPTRSSGYVRIDAASIDTGSSARDEHLRSNDFFDLANYPDIVFHTSKVEPIGEVRVKVTGDLTVKGVTHPVTIEVEYTGPVVDPFGNTRIGIEAFGTISRKDWNLAWNAPLEAGGVLVGDRITLEIDLSAVKRV
ncbi:MAG: hypothetical protein QOG22_4186 [Pseudonocardiales bacterium]|jgi:polyisoprenoid-binding protein YceI|nr:hypothetical protein [Pseudonocardiales bacterium]MDT4981115.1 hypothetical protein [Pseudonocardiales bacterium]